MFFSHFYCIFLSFIFNDIFQRIDNKWVRPNIKKHSSNTSLAATSKICLTQSWSRLLYFSRLLILNLAFNRRSIPRSILRLFYQTTKMNNLTLKITNSFLVFLILLVLPWAILKRPNRRLEIARRTVTQNCTMTDRYTADTKNLLNLSWDILMLIIIFFVEFYFFGMDVRQLFCCFGQFVISHNFIYKI